jgi:SAM-dependent methyltransferase
MTDQEFWNNRYAEGKTGWDLGGVSPALKFWIDKIPNKSARILLPGAGNAYEIDYLLENCFQNITVIDIAPLLVSELKKKYSDLKEVNILLGDFFELNETYDIILEQTFFCAINPALRKKYVDKMAELLAENGQLLGVLFDRDFEGGPPFGGSSKEYHELFTQKFNIELTESTVSHPARMGSEVLLKCWKS